MAVMATGGFVLIRTKHSAAQPPAGQRDGTISPARDSKHHNRGDTTMLKKRNLWILGLVVAITSFTQLNAQGGRMIRLGDAHVDGSTDHDSIKVGRSDGPFRAIQLRVSGGDVNFERVVVRYGDGSQEEIPVRSRIPNGGRTRIIDLPGARRIIRSVDLWYSKDRWTRRPKVTLYGLR
jgi:hypothetical protein